MIIVAALPSADGTAAAKEKDRKAGGRQQRKKQIDA
jgi:hypothetical protein